MFNQRHIAVAACATCWGGAASGLIVDMPHKPYSFMLATAVALLIWIRTDTSRSTRRVARISYFKGVHDTLKKVGTQPDVATVRRFPSRRAGVSWLNGSTASFAVITALVSFVVFTAIALASPMEHATGPTVMAPASPGPFGVDGVDFRQPVLSLNPPRTSLPKTGSTRPEALRLQPLPKRAPRRAAAPGPRSGPTAAPSASAPASASPLRTSAAEVPSTRSVSPSPAAARTPSVSVSTDGGLRLEARVGGLKVGVKVP